MPSREQLIARIAELEARIAPKPRAARGNTPKQIAKDAEKARKAQFKLEAFKRARLHCSINRYHI